MEVEANGEMDGNQYVFFLPTTNDLLIGVDSTNKYRIKFPIEHPNPLINIAKLNTNGHKCKIHVACGRTVSF